MTEETYDSSLDALLDLDGQVLVIDPAGRHWVKFVVTRVPVSPEKPHGLDYSLTLHGPDGERGCRLRQCSSCRPPQTRRTAGSPPPAPDRASL